MEVPGQVDEDAVDGEGLQGEVGLGKVQGGGGNAKDLEGVNNTSINCQNNSVTLQ